MATCLLNSFPEKKLSMRTEILTERTAQKTPSDYNVVRIAYYLHLMCTIITKTCLFKYIENFTTK